MNYKTHRKELLKDKTVKAAHEKLRPLYERVRKIFSRVSKKMIQA